MLARVATGQSQAPPSFPTKLQVVTIDALVLDREGTPVPGLRAEDFVVLEDGVPQDIASFEAFTLEPPNPQHSDPAAMPAPVVSNLRVVPGGARTFVVLVDDFGIAPDHEKDVRQAVIRFAREGLRDGDELLFLTTSGEVRWSLRMPEGLADLEAVAARVRGRKLTETTSDFMSEWEAYQISRVESPTGARLESGGLRATSDESGAAVAAPTTSVTERVVTRWLDRRFCSSDAIQTPAGVVRPGVPVCRSQVGGRARAIDDARTRRTRDVLARVDEAVFALSTHRGRKALLLLTEGFLNDADLDPLRNVAARCREANIAVYAVDVRGLAPASGELAAESPTGAPDGAELSLMRQEQLSFEFAGSAALAEDTGGVALRDSNDLGGAAVRVAQESRVYYLLGILSPPGKGARDWRALRVATRRNGLVVRARKGYTLRNAAEIQRSERDARAASRRLAAGIDPPPLEVSRALASGLDHDEIPLRATALTFGDQPDSRVHAVVALEADLGRIANLGGEDHPLTVLSLSVFVTHRDTGETRRIDQQVKVDAGEGGARFEGWLMLSRDFDLRPGVHQARVVVRDEFLGRTGAVTVRFEVPAPGGFRLSSPILTDRSVGGSPEQPPRPVLVARRTFASAGMLYCQYEVLGAASRPGEPVRVQASHEMLGADGAVAAADAPRMVVPGRDGRLMQLLRLPLDRLAAGPYELLLRVEDLATGQVVERKEPFLLETRRASTE